jgi:hypothetical protein
MADAELFACDSAGLVATRISVCSHTDFGACKPDALEATQSAFRYCMEKFRAEAKEARAAEDEARQAEVD